MSLTIAPFESLIAEALTGAIISGGQNGDPVKITARANAALAAITGIQQILAGNATAGVASLTAAAKITNIDPGIGLAVQGALLLVAQQAALVNSVAGATILGTVQAAIANNIIQGATAAANAEIAKYAAAVAATPAAPAA